VKQIIREMRKEARGFAVAALLTASTVSEKAEDFLIGTRGPTPLQFDHGVNYIRKETQSGASDNFIQSNVVKYWTGKELGFFAIGALPYKFLKSRDTESSGFGDLTLKLGPRGTIDLHNFGSFHWIAAAGTAIPLGDTDTKPALGTGRYDFKGGFTTTYLSHDKKDEMTTAFEYNKPLTLHNGKPASDEINAGFIVGKKLNDNWRIGAGLRGTYKIREKDDGDYITKARILARYTFSKNPMWHIEIIGDKSIKTKYMPDETMGSILIRYNFGKK